MSDGYLDGIVTQKRQSRGNEAYSIFYTKERFDRVTGIGAQHAAAIVKIQPEHTVRNGVQRGRGDLSNSGIVTVPPPSCRTEMAVFGFSEQHRDIFGIVL
jgi:hypothetical protein